MKGKSQFKDMVTVNSDIKGVVMENWVDRVTGKQHCKLFLDFVKKKIKRVKRTRPGLWGK